MALSVVLFLALLVVVALGRAVEAIISCRHQRLLGVHGVRVSQEAHFRWMVLLHIGVLGGAALELLWWRRPLIPSLAVLMGIAFVAANAMRWWVIRTLGVHWNIGVMDSVRFGVVAGGPYRFVRHPNYTAVFVELAALPLIHTAWVTALAGSAAHVWVLSRRVAVEERVLLADPAYRVTMARKPRFIPGLLTALVTSAVLLLPHGATGEPVTVHYTEGLIHGFLVLRTPDGSHLANGDLMQTADGDRVTSRLVFHFDDGSLYDETTVFSQRGQFRLVRDHLLQKGPSFPTSLDMSIDAASGQVSVRSTDHDGKAQQHAKHLDLPADLANGLIPVLLKNVRPEAPPKSFGFIAATPEPRLVKLEIESGGETSFSTGGAVRNARCYVLKVNLGGLTALLAPLLGKQPPDSDVWILEGEAPAFVRAEEPLYAGGPLWRIELAGPVWHEGK